MTGSRFLPLLAGAGCLGVGLFSSIALADDPVVFRSDVSLVRVEAQVVDGSNRAITGLGPQDFVLRESGQVQKIQSVDSENVPIDLLLLLDVSASMRPHIQRISTAAHDALRQMRPSDRIAIMVFDRSTRVRMRFGNSRDAERELEQLLYDETFRGGTDITLGMYDAADFLRQQGRPEARKAIVIVTDDETERNRDVDGVSRALSRADAVLSALIAPDAMRNGGVRGGYPGGGYPGGGLGGIIFGRQRGGYPRGGGYGSHTQSAGTREIALRSGGDSMPVDDSYALENTLERIRQRYALHFYLPQGVRPGEERYITVELASATRNRYPGADIRYRQSYYAPIGNVAPGRVGGGSSAPDVVTSGSQTPSDSDRPVTRRRPAVSQPDSGDGGPLIPDGGSAPSASAPAPHASSPAPPPPSSKPAAPSSPSSPGWRTARPDEVPHQ
ncbi:MAG TPA: VWA domain-containing protein [Bryobacteraceae bacterium]